LWKVGAPVTHPLVVLAPGIFRLSSSMLLITGKIRDSTATPSWYQSRGRKNLPKLTQKSLKLRWFMDLRSILGAKKARVEIAAEIAAKNHRHFIGKTHRQNTHQQRVNSIHSY
jgi:hypothetical protein